MKLGALGKKLFASQAAAVKTAIVLAGAIVMEAGVVITYKLINDGPDIALATEQIDDASTQFSGISTSSNLSNNQDIVDTPDIYIPGSQQESSSYQPPK